LFNGSRRDLVKTAHRLLKKRDASTARRTWERARATLTNRIMLHPEKDARGEAARNALYGAIKVIGRQGITEAG
jgi:hypothetical protein